MVESEYQNERYMVDGGKWYRRLKVGEEIAREVEVSIDSTTWHEAGLRSPPARISYRDIENGGHYRVPCTDPRPPFIVGQRVKVARRSGDAYLDQLFGQCGIVSGIDAVGEVGCEFDHIDVRVSLPPWCLGPVDPSPDEEGYKHVPEEKKSRLASVDHVFVVSQPIIDLIDKIEGNNQLPEEKR